MLLNEGAAIDFVRDAFGHLKAIGFTAEAEPLLQKAAIAPDGGVVNIAETELFLAAARTRQWNREPKVRMLA
jgi:catalase